MRAAKSECGSVAVSLFVNPTQFGPKEDFDRYPRDEARDFSLAESIGVDVLFVPTIEEMYPRNTTAVRVSGVSELWEGQSRPGHFEGVATVVCKLFQIIRPDIAYFGLKDFQQCAVVRRMAEDLAMPIELRFVDTVREPDGLAMSSRNARLDSESRAKAPMLYLSLQDAAAAIRANPVSQSTVRGALEDSEKRLSAAGFEVDYFALVDAETLNPIWKCDRESRLIAAARIGDVRLIDNCAL